MSETMPLRDQFLDLHLYLRPKGFCCSFQLSAEASFEVVVLTNDTYAYALDFGGIESWNFAYSIEDLLHALAIDATEFDVKNWRSDRP